MRMRSKISALVKRYTWKLFPQSETVCRYKVFKFIEPRKMDEELLGTLTRHYVHIFDKITKRRWVEGKRSIYYDKLTEAIKTGHEKKFDASDDILWTELIQPEQSLPMKKDKGVLYEIIRQRKSIYLIADITVVL